MGSGFSWKRTRPWERDSGLASARSEKFATTLHVRKCPKRREGGEKKGVGRRKERYRGSGARRRWAGEPWGYSLALNVRTQLRTMSQSTAGGASVLMACGWACEKDTRWPWSSSAELA